MNTKYGKLVDGKLVYAPAVLDTGDGIKMNPSEASYLAAGWKRIIDEPPTGDETSVPAFSGWTENETTLTKTYKLIPKPLQEETGGETGASWQGLQPPQARRFSKLKTVIALKEEGIWVLTKAWLEENGLYDLYLAAQDFAEDNEHFLRGKTELQQLARLTDEQVEAILSRCTAD